MAQAVRKYRELRKLSYNQLAQRLTEIGRPIASLGLRRIERGERRVDLDDLLALARALEVHPVLLVFPLGQAASVEVLPGVERPTWQTVKWFTGDAAFPDERPSGRHDYLAGTHGDAQAFFSSATPVVMHREHDRRMEEVRWALGRVPIIAEALAKAASAEERAAHQARLDDARADLAQRERAVVDHRRRMREAGVVPPPLESALAHLETGSGTI